VPVHRGEQLLDQARTGLGLGDGCCGSAAGAIEQTPERGGAGEREQERDEKDDSRHAPR
jgi:hypothetical protein